MSRVQLALNVDDLQASIDFYSTLFNAQPAKVHAGYAPQAASGCCGTTARVADEPAPSDNVCC